MTDEQRRSANTRLKVAFVLLVGASGGLVALQTEGTPLQLALGVLGGLVVGALLLWFLVRWSREFWTGTSRR